MAGEVGVGLLELGVRRPAAAALELELLVEPPRALHQLAVLVGPLALHGVDDRGLLPGVRQLDAKRLAVAPLRAQARDEPRHGARGLRRRREQAHGLLQVVGAEATQVAPRVDAERRRAPARSGDGCQQPVTRHGSQHDPRPTGGSRFSATYHPFHGERNARVASRRRAPASRFTPSRWRPSGSAPAAPGGLTPEEVARRRGTAAVRTEGSPPWRSWGNSPSRSSSHSCCC